MSNVALSKKSPALSNASRLSSAISLGTARSCSFTNTMASPTPSTYQSFCAYWIGVTLPLKLTFIPLDNDIPLVKV